MATLTGPAKLAAVTELMDKLTRDLTVISMLPAERDAVLEQLKLYGRDPRNADPIFTKEGINTLARHAFHSPSSETSRHALRVLCNALLLKQETRQMFVNMGFEAKACEQLKSENQDDEFLVSRLIFLTTYASANMKELLEKHDLAKIINKNLERHVSRRSDGKQPTNPMDNMALAETLKLLFNLSHHCKEHQSLFTPAVPHIIQLLCKIGFTVSRPLDPPTQFLINALLNLDLSAKEVHSSIYPQAAPGMMADRLVSLLECSRTAYNDEELESIVTSLIGVIRAIHEYAPADIKASIRARLLPTDDDRNEVLGRSDTIRSWILRNSTNPVTPQLRETISDLLFDMSDKDAQVFMDNVGYGFASGFLFNRNLPIPQNATGAFANLGASSSRGSTKPVNPITGQFLDSERHPDIPEMTEEEKEREAERLFVLFERMRANGVINVENPVRTAQQEGRFEELPDDYEEEK